MSMISVYYYLKVAKAMYIGTNDDVTAIKLGKAVGAALWVCLAGTLLFGLYPGPLSNLAQAAIQTFL